jgi:hypothetical protein
VLPCEIDVNSNFHCLTSSVALCHQQVSENKHALARLSCSGSWIAIPWDSMEVTPMNSETDRDQQRPAQNQHKTAKPAETSRDQHETSTKQRNRQRPAKTSTKQRNRQRSARGFWYILALSVESASSADVYIYIIGAGCWIGIPSRVGM